MAKKFVLFGFLLLSLALSYYLYTPLPPSIDEPWTVRAYLLIIEVTLKIATLGERLGLGTWANNVRTTQDFLSIHFIAKSPPDGMTVTDKVFDGVVVRVYQPQATNEELTGAIVYYHGGGWVYGSIHTYEHLTMALAFEIGIPVVSVGYRLAPEFTYPVPLEDCVAATVHFMKNAKEFSVDPNKIVIMGDSAGGNLAAAATLRFKQLNSTNKPISQVLIYPVLQAFDFQLPAHLENDGVAWLSGHIVVYHILIYIGADTDLIAPVLANNHTTAAAKAKYADVFDVNLLPEQYRSSKYQKSFNEGSPEVVDRLKKHINDPFVAPLMATSDHVRGLPSTYIITAGFDPLRDEGILYAKKLEKAGVAVKLADYPTGYHPFLMQIEGPLATKLARQAFDDLVQYTKQILKTK